MQKIVESHRIVQGYDTYSQAHQDLFVRLMLNFKRNGCYVEIGSADPIQSNNTYILERDFGWKGLSLEIDNKLSDNFNKVRLNKCICADATSFNFKDAFDRYNYNRRIDYLSLDIDPAPATYSALTSLPLDDYRFSVITYEHDNYVSGSDYMLKSRMLLESHGYVRVVSNVLCCGRDFEDWYVDTTFISRNQYHAFISNNIECIDIFKNIGVR